MIQLVPSKLTHANAVIQLLRHVQHLVGGDVVLAHERAVVCCDHGDVGIFPCAELGIVVARLSVDHGRGSSGTAGGSGRIHTAVTDSSRSCTSDQQSPGVTGSGDYSPIARGSHCTIVVSGCRYEDRSLTVTQGDCCADLFIGTRGDGYGSCDGHNRGSISDGPFGLSAGVGGSSGGCILGHSHDREVGESNCRPPHRAVYCVLKLTRRRGSSQVNSLNSYTEIT
jgi:hypothetical protein